MIDKIEKNQCILCGACSHICPKQSISFIEGYCSFHYPAIDDKTCISCNLCETVCPAIHVPESNIAKQYFAAKNKSDDIKKISSSGGIFYALANAVLAQSGYVCGAMFDKDFHVKHITTNSLSNIQKLCGSKYVQSDLTDCLPEIDQLLRKGQTVLFVGCPCQTAALKNLFPQKENLILVDFICHGAVSADVFDEYKQYLERKYKGKIVSFNFRGKENGWLFSGLDVVFDNGRRYQSPLVKDLYMQGYFKNLNLKEACYSCAYKNYHSGSDITLGDFWGIQHLKPDFYDYWGNSLIVINTDKGQEWIQKITDHIETVAVSESDILVENQGLIKSFKPSADRQAYFAKAEKTGYIAPLKKYLKPSPLPVRVIRRLKRFLRK